jgi:hypothetical protein
LFVLFVLRGSYTTAFGGLAVAAVANIATMAVFLPHFLNTENLLELLANNQAVIEADPAVDPLLSGSRVDLLMVIERLMGRHLPGVLRMAVTFGVLFVAGFAVRRLHRSLDRGFSLRESTPFRGAKCDESGRFDSLAVAMLAIAICIYHNIYDALLIAPAAFAAWRGYQEGKFAWQRRWRMIALAALLVPAVNFFTSNEFLTRISEIIPPAMAIVKQPGFWTLLCVLNGMCITAAWAILLVGAFRKTKMALIHGPDGLSAGSPGLK